ncbi:hypothetical protein C6W19_00330 [Bacillus sp. RJGP41]|nr:hypothetical protein C6W19_00330 [Bacillus sp. RJGP41]
MRVKKIHERSNIVWFAQVFMVLTVILTGFKKFVQRYFRITGSRDTKSACFNATWQTFGGKGANF